MPTRKLNYRQIFERMLNGFALFELVMSKRGVPIDGVILEVNPAFETITGRERAKVVGRKAKDLFRGINPPLVEVFRRVVQAGEPVLTEGFGAAFGRYLEIAAFSPRRGRCAVVFADVTDRKWAEEEVQASRERLRFILENTRDIIYAADPEGIVTYVSPQIAILGYTPVQVIGSSMLSHVHPDDLPAVQEVLKKAMTAGWELPLEMRLVGVDGRVIHVEESGRIHRKDGKVTGITGAIRDVSARKKAEAERKQLITERDTALAKVKELSGGAGKNQKN